MVASGRNSGQSARESRLLPGTSSFLLVKCREGYRCVSKVSGSGGVPGFGKDHTGDFHKEKPGLGSSDNKYNNTYEVGCPIRGTWDDAAVKCMVNGSEGQSVGVGCWSDDSFESDAGYCDVDADEGKCLCVAKTTANGVPDPAGQGYEFVGGVVDALGQEFHTGEYNVDPSAGCRHCEALSLTCDEAACSKCKNCMYKQVPVEGQEQPVGICVDKKEKKGAQEEPEGEGPGIFDFDTLSTRPGQGSKQSKRLRILPHYRHPKIRDLDKGPFNAMSPQGVGGPQYVSRGQWQKNYKELAPFLQAHLDDFRRVLVSSVEQPLEALSCQEPAPAGQALQGTLLQLDNLAKKAHAFTRMQRECRGMQAVKQKIAPNLGFAIDGASTLSGEPLQCKKSKGVPTSPGAGCTQLNCYVADLELRPTLERMLTKLDACSTFYRMKVDQSGRNLASGAPANSPAPAASGVGFSGVILLAFESFPVPLGLGSSPRIKPSSRPRRGTRGSAGLEEKTRWAAAAAATHQGFL